MRIALISFAALLVVAATPALHAQEPPLALGQIDESVHRVTGAVVQAVLVRLGHEGTITEARASELFPLFREGKVDLLVAARVPNEHRFYMERDGDNAVILATLYEGAQLYWAVPEYIPESQVKSIADLAKKKIVERTDPIVIGTAGGPERSFRSIEALRIYGLRKLEYDYRYFPVQNPNALLDTGPDGYSAVATAIEQQLWVVAAVMRPSYLFHTLSLRPLADPKGVLGGPDRAVLIAQRALLDRLPAPTVAALKRIQFSLENVNELDDLSVRIGVGPREAARRWMLANPKQVDSWFAEPTAR
jgi:glycine betaine/proline transport system substrate-binding protein